MTRRLIVTGRVQGVGYRDWTVGAARALGLSGWVRNRPEGSVEILADGPEAGDRGAGAPMPGKPASRPGRRCGGDGQ